MDKSTVNLAELAEDTDIYCGECRRKSWSVGGPGHTLFLGHLVRIGDSPVFWRLERFSHRIELGTPLTFGIHPRGGYEVLGDLKEVTMRRMGYPSRAMFERDVARVAQLAEEGVRAFDVWFDFCIPTLAMQRGLAVDARRLLELTQHPQLRSQIWKRQRGRPTRLAMTSIARGIRARCGKGHDLRVSRERLTELLRAPSRDGDKLFLPAS